MLHDRNDGLCNTFGKVRDPYIHGIYLSDGNDLVLQTYRFPQNTHPYFIHKAYKSLLNAFGMSIKGASAQIFLERALELYQPFIADYNKLMNELNVHEHIHQYLASMKGIIPSKELAQFAKDVGNEFQPL